MPNPTKKKRWLVGTYGNVTVASSKEAQDFEDKLNEFADKNYEIYEVSFDKQTIVGRLHDDDDDEEEEIEEGSAQAAVMPVAAGGVINSILASIARTRATAQQQQSQSPATEEPPAYLVMNGARTGELLNGIQAAVMIAELGDPSGEQRLTRIIQHLFSKAPPTEVQKTLDDIERFHVQHRKTQCDDPGCVTSKLLVSTQEKLKAQLAAMPLN